MRFFSFFRLAWYSRMSCSEALARRFVTSAYHQHCPSCGRISHVQLSTGSLGSLSALVSTFNGVAVPDASLLEGTLVLLYSDGPGRLGTGGAATLKLGSWLKRVEYRRLTRSEVCPPSCWALPGTRAAGGAVCCCCCFGTGWEFGCSMGRGAEIWGRLRVDLRRVRLRTSMSFFPSPVRLLSVLFSLDACLLIW